VLKSDLAQSIAQLLQSERLTLLMDQWFRREAASTNAAVWHHDEPYFDFFDGQKCVVWLPLESASSNEGLTLIGGSHRWNKLYMAQNFGHKKPFSGDMSDYCEIEDFSEHADRFVIWDMEPGDCLIFDFRTIHRATSHDQVSPRTLHHMSYRYGDLQVKFKARGVWTSEISEHLLALGQRENEAINNALCPVVYQRNG
jgi:ectoine hydroxylase-related dioxygenase (phytanoyl-CoA dioxygenase family)